MHDNDGAAASARVCLRLMAAMAMAILAGGGCTTLRGAPAPTLQPLACPAEADHRAAVLAARADAAAHVAVAANARAAAAAAGAAADPARAASARAAAARAEADAARADSYAAELAAGGTTVAHGCDADLNALLRLGMSDDERNLYIDRGIIEIDQAYAVYVRGLRNERVALGLTTALLDLGAEVAATLTNSVGVQKNWAALGLLVNGTYGIVDEQAFMEKTVGALVESMRAARLPVLERLRAGMGKPSSEYSLSAAHHDLQEYASAGTLEGGLSFAQATARNEAEQIQERIDDAPPLARLSDTERLAKLCVTRAIEPTDAMPPRAQLDAAYTTTFGSAPATTTTDEQIRQALRVHNRSGGAASIQLEAALRGAGIITGTCSA